MSTVNDRFSPDEYIRQTFIELERLYRDNRRHIDDEIYGLTGKMLHDFASEDCLSSAKQADAFVFGPNADVIYEHLTYGSGEITDIAAEAITRRLCRDNADYLELAHFNSWLDILGYESLTKRKD